MLKQYSITIASVLMSLNIIPSLADATVPTKGQMLISADGSRLGAVYRVGSDGSAQLIFDGKMVTIPANTLSMADGKLTTSLKKSEVISLK